MINWKKYGMIAGAIATTYVVLSYLFNITSTVVEIVDASERVKTLEKKLHVYDSLHNTYEWRKKRADRYYSKFDSTFELLRKKRVL